MMDVPRIQALLRQFHIDGWLLYSYRDLNPIALRLLKLTGAHVTRRFALWIPADGEPVLVCSSIEPHLFEHLALPRVFYRSWNEWQQALERLLGAARRIAVEYSPRAELPSISYLDAGTAELLRALGKELCSSADLVQHIEAVWSAEQIADNLQTAQRLRAIMLAAFEHARTLAQSHTATEFDVQQFILHAFEREQLVTDHPPIVAIGSNTANPHYEPTAGAAAPLAAEAVLMIDMWAKSSREDATYADITWMGWLGSTPPEEVRSVMHTVVEARNAALALVRERFAIAAPLYGYEVDDAARSVIARAGYGECFIHRTGHNIGTEVHGFGANMDNYETRDTRRIIAGTSFSIEPGIYLPGRFGVRSECDVVIDHSGAVLVPSEPLQDELIILPV